MARLEPMYTRVFRSWPSRDHLAMATPTTTTTTSTTYRLWWRPWGHRKVCILCAYKKMRKIWHHKDGVVWDSPLGTRPRNAVLLSV